MSTDQDPVVRDLTKHINRSAGQHKRQLSEGTASARRILPPQSDDEAELLKQWRANVIANGLHRIDTSQMPVEFAGPEPREFDTDEPLMTLTELFVIVLIVGAVLGLAIKFYTP